MLSVSPTHHSGALTFDSSAYSVAFLPGDGDRIISGGNDGSLKIWSLSTGKGSTLAGSLKKVIKMVTKTLFIRYLLLGMEKE